MQGRDPEAEASVAPHGKSPSLRKMGTETHKARSALAKVPVTKKAKSTGGRSLSVCDPQATRDKNNVGETYARFCMLATTIQKQKVASAMQPTPRGDHPA